MRFSWPRIRESSRGKAEETKDDSSSPSSGALDEAPLPPSLPAPLAPREAPDAAIAMAVKEYAEEYDARGTTLVVPMTFEVYEPGE